ncbi:hypothetical protein [Psychrobacter vallis]|uniref:hypothetical protein n=1 Tax=Psychrobacter vallis TaxID=248451 RepID=UPI00191B83FA|nr:hypothetical protein [Psychrobacter vallis]
MKSTNKNPNPCEQFNAERASAQLRHEQDYAHKARLARQVINECAQEKSDKRSDDAAFWRAFYIFIHVVAALLVLGTLYRMWGQQ